MSRPLKITALGLEQQALKARADGLTVRQVADRLSATLRRRGVADTVSHSMVERYFAGLDKATVPLAHRPQAAVANAQLVVDVAQRTRDSLLRLDQLLPVAEAEVTAAGGKNWAAILGVLRESREHVRAYADLLERVHNAEQIAAFQQSVVDALQETSPDLRARFDQLLAERQGVVVARLVRG
jgi:hypothetical protein